MKKENKEYNKLMDALNRIDELACMSANNDNEIKGTGKGEAEQLEEDYNLVADFIHKATQDCAIEIDITDSDCEDLMNGEEFNWSFIASNGQDVGVRLYPQGI